MQAGEAGAELLWLETLQQLASRAAHELKGALNGVSVNLEVVRGRASQPQQPATAVSRFADSAATQLDRVIDMNEALLALARRARDPVDVGNALRHLGALLVPVAEASRLQLAVTVASDGMASAGTTPGAIVRTVLGRVMLAVMDAGGGTMHLATGEKGIVVHVACAHGAIALDPRTAALAAGAGVDITAGGPELTLTFPMAAPAPAPMGTATHETA